MTTTQTPQTPQTMTDQYRAEYAKDLVPAMLKAIKDGRHASMILLGVGLSITLFHVSSYLWKHGFGPIGLLITLLFDAGMVLLFHFMTTKALNVQAKLLSVVGCGFAAYMSIKLNLIAAGHDELARLLFPTVVGFVIFVKFVSAIMGPNWKAMAKYEAKAAPETPVKAPRTPEEQAKIDQAIERRKATIAEKNAIVEAALALATQPKPKRTRTPRAPKPAAARQQPQTQAAASIPTYSVEDLARFVK